MGEPTISTVLFNIQALVAKQQQLNGWVLVAILVVFPLFLPMAWRYLLLPLGILILDLVEEESFVDHSSQ